MGIWIYHGPEQSVSTFDGDLDKVYFRDGEYFESTRENFGPNMTEISGNVFDGGRWYHVRFILQQSSSVSSVEIGLTNGGVLRRMSRANSLRWGSHNYHAASNGNFYSLRRTTRLYKSDGTYHGKLEAGDQVIIANGFEYFNSGNTRVRIWGIRRKGGVAEERTGLWAEETANIAYPTGYHLNTI